TGGSDAPLLGPTTRVGTLRRGGMPVVTVSQAMSGQGIRVRRRAASTVRPSTSTSSRGGPDRRHSRRIRYATQAIRTANGDPSAAKYARNPAGGTAALGLSAIITEATRHRPTIAVIVTETGTVASHTQRGPTRTGKWYSVGRGLVPCVGSTTAGGSGRAATA